MECSDRRGAKGPPRRICRALLQRRQAGSGRRHPQSQRAGAHHDGNRRQEGEPLAPPDRRPLGRAIQLLCQRPALGPDVRAHVPVPAVLRPGLSQSTSLAAGPDTPAGHRLPAMLECLSSMRDTRTPPGTGRHPDRRRFVELPPQIAYPPHSILQRERTLASGLSAPAVLLADRILRQPDLSSAGRPRPSRPTPAPPPPPPPAAPHNL